MSVDGAGAMPMPGQGVGTLVLHWGECVAPDVYDKSGVKRDWLWLSAKYGNVQHTPQAGAHFALCRVDETEGPATLTVRVLDRNGQPLANQPVANAWPNMELGGNVIALPAGSVKRRYADVACVQRTGGDGYTGYGLGTGSYYLPPDTGPHTVWVLSPSVDSDGISGIGMLPNTVHAGPLALTFQLVDGTPEPPPVTPPPEPPPSTGGGSKLAWHFQNLPAWASSVVNSEWVKIIDPPATNPFPNARTIGRFYMPDAEEATYVARGAAGAVDYFNRMLPRYQAASWVWAVECTNEPGVATPQARANLVAFTRKWTELMHQADFRVVVLNLSVGWPDVGCAAELAGALETADYMGLHEYSAPTMQSGDGWLTLRYRRTVAELRAAGARVPPIIIGELGIDGGVLNPPQPKHGWKSYTDAAGYLAQLQWYDAELRKDAYVEAATIFTSGPANDWVDFDVDENLSRSLAAYINTQTPPAPPPVTPPPPPPANADMVAALTEYKAQACSDIDNLIALAANAQPPAAAGKFALRRPLPDGVGYVHQGFGCDKRLGTGDIDYSTVNARLAGHNGADYAAPTGTQVLAANTGRVHVGYDAAGYGNFVTVTTTDGNMTYGTLYAHLAAVLVTEGEQVDAGQQVGNVGSTGFSTGPHLHFSAWVDGIANPAYLNYLDPVLGRKINGDA